MNDSQYSEEVRIMVNFLLDYKNQLINEIEVGNMKIIANQDANTTKLMNIIKDMEINKVEQNSIPFKYFKCSPSRVNIETFIGRDNNIKELKELIYTGNYRLLISGFGGIGKTTIANFLYQSLEEKYRYVSWIDYKGNLKDSFLNSDNVYDKGMDNNIRWEKIKKLYTDLKDETLVFIDDLPINIESDENFKWLISLKYLVVTSRECAIVNFKPYNIDFLNIEDSIDVFYSYYKYDVYRNYRNIVVELLKMVQNHTFSIELLAGVANVVEYRGDLKKYLYELDNKGFGFPKGKTRTNHTFDEMNISQHLIKLFDFLNFTDEEVIIISNLAIIRKGMKIPKKNMFFLDIDMSVYQKLEQSRMINFDNENFIIHDITWETIRLKYPKISYDKAEKMIDGFLCEDYFSGCDKILEANTKLEIACDYEVYYGSIKSECWGKLLNVIGLQSRRMGKYEKSLDYHIKAKKIFEESLPKDYENITATYIYIGMTYNNKGKCSEALNNLKIALSISEKELDCNHKNFEFIYSNIANIYSDQGLYDESLNYYEKAICIYLKNSANLMDIATIYNNKSWVYSKQGFYDKALEYYKKTATTIESEMKIRHVLTAVPYNNIAGIYSKQGNYVEALDYFKKALNIRESKFGVMHRSTSNIYNNIAVLYYKQGNYEQAVEDLINALKITISELGKDHIDTAIIYNNIADAYSKQKNYKNALEYYQSALQIRESELPNNHPDIARTYNNMAVVYGEQNQLNIAWALFEKALNMRKQVFTNKHPDIAESYNDIGDFFFNRHQYNTSLEYYMMALEIREDELNICRPDIATTYCGVGKVYFAQGEYI